MAAIYDKALKRKDLSGTVDNKSKDTTTAGKNDNSPTKADNAKAGADVGKIVNLMANDANKERRRISC